MRKAVSFIVTIMLFFTQAAYSAAPLCGSVHLPAQGTYQRIGILQDSAFEVSELRLIQKDFNPGSTGLAELLSMAAQTAGNRIDEKTFNKKNEITLGLMLKNDYSLEFRYELDDRGNSEKLVLQNVVMVSPTVFRKDITKQALDRNEFKFHADGVHELKDLFPSGHRITAQVPMFVDKSVFSEFQKLLPRLGNLKKGEIRELVESGNIKKLKFLGHFRAVKEFVQEALTKMSFKEAVRMGVLVIVMNYFNGGTTTQVPVPQATTAATHQWISDVGISLGMALGKDLKQEVLQLNKEIQDRSNVRTQNVGLDFNRPKLQIGESDFVWLVEKAETQKTYLAFSRDNKSGNLEYFLIEINPALYPKTIQALKDSKLQMNLK